MSLEEFTDYEIKQRDKRIKEGKATRQDIKDMSTKEYSDYEDYLQLIKLYPTKEERKERSRRIDKGKATDKDITSMTSEEKRIYNINLETRRINKGKYTQEEKNKMTLAEFEFNELYPTKKDKENRDDRIRNLQATKQDIQTMNFNELQEYNKRVDARNITDMNERIREGKATPDDIKLMSMEDFEIYDTYLDYLKKSPDGPKFTLKDYKKKLDSSLLTKDDKKNIDIKYEKRVRDSIRKGTKLQKRDLDRMTNYDFQQYENKNIDYFRKF